MIESDLEDRCVQCAGTSNDRRISIGTAGRRRFRVWPRCRSCSEPFITPSSGQQASSLPYPRRPYPAYPGRSSAMPTSLHQQEQTDWAKTRGKHPGVWSFTTGDGEDGTAERGEARLANHPMVNRPSGPFSLFVTM